MDLYAWILIKTNIDRVRLATDSEWLGAELIKVLSDDAKQHIEKEGQRGYVDTANEEGPPEDESEETGDAAVEKDAAEAPETASAGIPRAGADDSYLSPIAEEEEDDQHYVDRIRGERGDGRVTPEIRRAIEEDLNLQGRELQAREQRSAVVSSATTARPGRSIPSTPSRRGNSNVAPPPRERRVRARHDDSPGTVSQPGSEPLPQSEINDDLSLAEAGRTAQPYRPSSSSTDGMPHGGWAAARARNRNSPYAHSASMFTEDNEQQWLEATCDEGRV